MARSDPRDAVGVQSFQRLDALCDEFEQAWRRGERPPLEQFVERASGSQRQELFRELLALEIDYRKELGEASSAEDYVRRFPAWSAEVETIFARASRDGDSTVHQETPTARKATSSAHPTISGYDIEGILGKGGMGVVYSARQLGLNRTVAIKMISTPGQDREAMSRFLAEAETVARLQHPHIVQVFEVGQAQSMPFFSLELIAGGNLRDHCHGAPLEPRRAAELVETLSRAVAYLHEHGIVHRDLKPANVLLTKDGTPKITDFGLAKLMGVGDGQTRTGDILGTPSYMAPEQAAGKIDQVGPLADVYALGAILYELLTGKPPFRGATPIETVRWVLDVEPLPPSRLRPGLPRDLETICLKCLQKEPMRRYESAQALADDLRRFLNHEPIQARPVRWLERGWKWARRRPALASLIAVIALATAALAISGWAFNAQLRSLLSQVEETSEDRRRGLVRMQLETGNRKAETGDYLGALPWFAEALKLSDTHPEQAAMVQRRISALFDKSPQVRQTWAHDGPVRHVAFSPDGLRLATTCGDGAARIFDLDTGKQVVPPMRHDGYVSFVAFSADGLRLATASYDKTARIWDATTGLPLTPPLVTAGPLHLVAFSPDDTRLLTCGDGDALLWDAATGQQMSPAIKSSATLYGAFHPDGAKVVLTGFNGIANVHDVATGKVLTYRKVHMAGPRPGKVIRYGQFSPDGKRVLLPMGPDAEVWHTTTWTKAEPFTPGAPRWPALHATFSPTGHLTVSAGNDGTARFWGAEVNNLQSLWDPIRHGAPIHHVAFGPDGRQIVTVGTDNTAQLWHVPTGVRLGPALMHGGVLHHAAFSPDGRLLATCGEEGVVRVWDLASLWPSERPLLDEPVSIAEVAPHGQIAVRSQFKEAVKLWNPTTGESIARLPQRDVMSRATFSNDGQRLATCNLKGEVHVWDVPSARMIAGPLPVDGAIVLFAFSPAKDQLLAIKNLSKFDGKGITFTSELLIWDIAQGKLALEPIRSSGVFLHADFSPDGRRVAGATTDHFAQIWNVADGKPVGVRMQHRDRVVKVGFSPDGKRLVTAGHDRTARVWDAETGLPSFDPLDHGDDLLFAKFGPLGRIVTGGMDRSARVWDAHTGKPITPPLLHGMEVLAAEFSADEKLLVTRTAKAVRVWEVATGIPVTPSWQSPFGQILDARFTDDGEALRLHLIGGTVVSWRLNSKPAASTSGDHLPIYSGQTIDLTGAAHWMAPAKLEELFRKQTSTIKNPLHSASWHRSEANDGAGLWHLDRLIQIAPEKNAYFRRAAWYRKLGDNERADSDQAKAEAK